LSKGRLTSGCSRIATARFFKRFLLAKLVYNEAGFADPQSAELRALDAFIEIFVSFKDVI
jgi:hypothetical protein